jgi:hypothetical protein
MCASALQHVVGPVHHPRLLRNKLVCAVCDATDADLSQFCTDAESAVCTTEWLTGKQLSRTEATCFCWETDPFPEDQFPSATMSERRFHHYYTIGVLLGVTGRKNRADLPNCVKAKIAALYGDAGGSPTQVGFREADAAA